MTSSSVSTTSATCTVDSSYAAGSNLTVGSNYTGSNYKEQLHPWCIVKREVNEKDPVILKRFRRCNDAEAYIRANRHPGLEVKYIPAVAKKEEEVSLPSMA